MHDGHAASCPRKSIRPLPERRGRARPRKSPFNTWGKQDPFGDWAGWLYASDADTGVWKWRAKTNYPILSGVTPTAGGLVFFGDMGGNVYALDADEWPSKLWGEKIGGAIGGGVITYQAQGAQKVAVATGLTEILWPTEITPPTVKVSILGLDAGKNRRFRQEPSSPCRLTTVPSAARTPSLASPRNGVFAYREAISRKPYERMGPGLRRGTG